MDEVELAQKNQKKFQENLIREQEELLENSIEESRERDRLAGIEAQKKLQEEADIQETKTRVQLEEAVLSEQDLIQQQIDEDARIERGEELYENNINQDEITETTNPVPPFPLVALMVAIFKDLFDIILAFTGVGEVLVILYSAIYDALSFAWAFKRLEGIKASQEKKRTFKSKMIRRLTTMVCVSLVPFLDALPEATVMVWRNYKAEVALAKGKV